MEITLTAELESALQAAANARGVAPEVVAVDALRERFLRNGSSIEPRDEWERDLLAASRECGVSLPNSALSSEGIYD
jgi:hypothetical protein